MQYAFVPKGKRKVNYAPVAGTITPELKDWLTKVFAEKVTVMNGDKKEMRETGKNTTGFEIFLSRIETEFKPGILSTLAFHSDNDSEDYYANPFKLIVLNDKAILTLVNVAPKQKEMKFNPETGRTDIHYSQRYFKVGDDQYRKSYVPKKNYCRLVLQQDKVMEVAQPVQEAAASE